MISRLRQVVRIDRESCDGCGRCVSFCPERALALADGKALLVAEELCDGLGGCAKRCPNNALVMEQRTAAEYHPTARVSFDREYVQEEGDSDETANRARHRLTLCCRAAQCGRICHRLIKQPGKVGVWCVDLSAGQKVNLYDALAQPEFRCPEGVF